MKAAYQTCFFSILVYVLADSKRICNSFHEIKLIKVRRKRSQMTDVSIGIYNNSTRKSRKNEYN